VNINVIPRGDPVSHLPEALRGQDVAMITQSGNVRIFLSE